MNKINYVVAKKWSNTDAIGAYSYYSNQVFYGTIKEAKKFAKHVSKQENIQYNVYVLQKIN